MGSCVSTPKDRSVKGSRSREWSLNGRDSAGELSSKSKPAEIGSEEEIFFDSHECLDSDSEDDFISVNGDVTPSRGSIPNYQINNGGAPQLNKASSVDTFPDTKSEPSLIDRKKRLYELIQEDQQGEQVGTEQCARNGKLKTNGKPENFKLDTDQLPRSLNGTPYHSGTNSACSSHLTPNRDLKHHKEETVKSKQSSLLTLIQSTRFSNRMKKKKKKSPAC